jgi:hypothetical protein
MRTHRARALLTPARHPINGHLPRVLPTYRTDGHACRSRVAKGVGWIEGSRKRGGGVESGPRSDPHTPHRALSTGSGDLVARCRLQDSVHSRLGFARAFSGFSACNHTRTRLLGSLNSSLHNHSTSLEASKGTTQIPGCRKASSE